MKSRVLYLALLAMLCMSTVALCEIISVPHWEGEGGTGDYVGSEASAVASGEEDFDENCATGTWDLYTTEAGGFDINYYLGASAFASYINNGPYGSLSHGAGSGYADYEGGPLEDDHCQAYAEISGNSNWPDSDYDYNEPEAHYDSYEGAWFEAYEGISAWHTVWAKAKISTGSDNEATGYGSAEAAIHMEEYY